jgi:ABC-type branched-subunit amino acid transport system substrate-binding protein
VRRWGPLAVALLLPAGVVGCGARWDDDERASVEARYASSDGAVAGGETASTGRAAGPSPAGTATTVGAGRRATVTTGGVTGSGAVTSGDVASPAGPRPCAAPSDAPGVTDTELTVGTISSLSGPVPGLGRSAAAAARAYVAYRNSTGGVCGRQIVLREADDGTDNGRYRSVVGELGPQVFGLVGGFALGDVGGTDVVEQQVLPVVNTPSGEASSHVSTVFDINPGYPDPDAVIGKYRWLVEQGVASVAIAYLAVDQSRFEAELQRGLMEAAGIRVALDLALPLSTLSFDAPARAVANSGADYLWFIGDINAEAAMARALADTGYRPEFAEYFNFAYGTPFTDLAGAAAEGTVAFIRSLPNEEAGANPELGAFVDWMAQVAPGDDLDAFAVDSWASAKAFFDALESLPGPIGREAVVAQLAATDRYDAGGMFGPIRLGAEQTLGCVVGVRYEGGEWRRLVPDTGFLC